MALPPISTVLAGIQHIPNKATQDLLEFDATATQFATEVQTLGSQANTWAGEVNTLKAAINVILGLLQDPLDPPADILRYLRSPGDIVWSSGPTPGAGTLVADGSEVSRTEYADLWERYNAAGWTWETCTIAIASPCVVSMASHGFTGGERLRFKSTGTLPTGISPTIDYFVVPVNSNTFNLSSTQGTATLVNTTVAGTGTISLCQSLWGLGDGTTTFNLPNLLGLFAAGVSSYGPVTSARDPNRKIGHVLASQNLWHTHSASSSTDATGPGGMYGNLLDGGTAVRAGSDGHAHNVTTQIGWTGGSEACPWHVALLPCVVY